MAAPLGEWPAFECVGRIRDTTGSLRYLGVSYVGEEFIKLNGNRLSIMSHAGDDSWLTDKALEQDVISGWRRTVGDTPQVTTFPGTLLSGHTDTPTWTYNPNLGVWIQYGTGRPGTRNKYLPQATSGRVGTIFYAVRTEAPQPDSAWVQNDEWIAAEPDESWEAPFYRNPPQNTEARGGCSEPTGVWVPEIHPTYGWPGYMKLFGRTLTVPNPPSPSGPWTWVQWYKDSPTGVDQWTPKQIFGDVRNELHTWITRWLPFRGSWQAQYKLDMRAGGWHGVMNVTNQSAVGGGRFIHYFSDNIHFPTYDTWEVNPNTPIGPGSQPLLPPSIGYCRTPSFEIDTEFPAYAGEDTERYLMTTNGGPDRTVSSPEQRYTYMLIGRRPKAPVSPPVSLGSVRLENYASTQRDSVFQCNISLPDQAMWQLPNTPGQPFPITVSTSTGERVQGRVVGPRYDSGNPRFIEVVLRDVMPTGNEAGYESYTNYASKSIELSSASVAPTPFNRHPEVDFASTDFRVTIPDPESPGSTVDLIFDLENATLVDGEADDDTGTNAIRRRYRAFARHVPAGNAPSLGATLLFEEYSNLRQVRWWVWVTNSYVPPSGEFQWDHTEYFLGSDVVVTHTGPAQCVVYYSDTMLSADPTFTAPNVTSWSLIDISQGSAFPDGYERMNTGVWLFDNGATGLAADTMAAEAAFIPEAQGQTWHDQGWGPMQTLLQTPQNSLIQGDPELARQRAAAQAVRDMQYYSNARLNWIWELHGHYPLTGSAGDSNEFASTRGTHLASSGIADFRALRLSVWQEGYRYYHFLNPDGTLVHPYDRTGLSGQATDCYFWHGRPFFSNKPEYPTPQTPSFSDSYGKRKNVAPAWSAPLATWPGTSLAQNCVGYDNEHWSGLWIAALAQMTGDPYAMHLAQANVNSLLSQMWPVYDDRESLGTGPGGTGGTAVTSQITGLKESRAEGRMGIVMCALYWATGDPKIPEALGNRMSNVIDTDPYNGNEGLRGSRQGWLGRHQDRTQVRIIRKDQVNTRQSPPGNSVNCWQQTFNMLFYWAAFKVTGDTRFKDIAAEQSYGITQYCTRKGTSSAFKWQIASSLIYNPYGVDAEPILPDDMEDGQRSELHPIPGAVLPNPTLFLYAWWYAQGQELWSRPAAVLGYELAVQEGNEQWRSKCAEIIADFIPTEEASKGEYGWGNRYTNNVQDWIALVPDPWKQRSVATTFTGGGTGAAGGPAAEGMGTVGNPPIPGVSGAGTGVVSGPLAEGAGSVALPAVSGGGVGICAGPFAQGQGAIGVPPEPVSGAGTGLVGGPAGRGFGYSVAPVGAPTIYVPR